MISPRIQFGQNSARKDGEHCHFRRAEETHLWSDHADSARGIDRMVYRLLQPFGILPSQ